MTIVSEESHLEKVKLLSKFLVADRFTLRLHQYTTEEQYCTHIITDMKKSKDFLYFLEIGFRFDLLLTAISKGNMQFEESIKNCEGIKFNPYEMKVFEALKPIQLLHNANLEFVVKMIKTKNIKIEEAVEFYKSSHVSFISKPESYQGKSL